MKNKNEVGCAHRNGRGSSCKLVVGHEGACAFTWGALFPEQKPTTCEVCGGPARGHIVVQTANGLLHCSKLGSSWGRD